MFGKAMEAFELTVGRDEREPVSPEAHKMVLLPRVVCWKLENKGKSTDPVSCIWTRPR